MRSFLLLALALLAAVLPARAHAQNAPRAAVSLSAGSRVYGDGESTLTVALRAEYPIHPAFVIEAAGSVADPIPEAGATTTSVFEVLAQAQLPGRAVVPYLGFGLGRVRIDAVSGGGAVVTGAAGARIDLGRDLGLVVDARIRDALSGEGVRHTDLTAGLRYSFR